MNIYVDLSLTHTGILYGEKFIFYRVSNKDKIININNYVIHKDIKSDIKKYRKEKLYFKIYKKYVEIMINDIFKEIKKDKKNFIYLEDYSYGSKSNNLIQTGAITEFFKLRLFELKKVNFELIIISIQKWKGNLKKIINFKNNEDLFNFFDMKYKKYQMQNLKKYLYLDLISCLGMKYLIENVRKISGKK